MKGKKENLFIKKKKMFKTTEITEHTINGVIKRVKNEIFSKVNTITK